MTKRDFKDLEEISDYSIALMEEILWDIKQISESSSLNISHSSLNDVKKKIDFARWKWVKVDILDKQVLDFRVILRNENELQFIQLIKLLLN